MENASSQISVVIADDESAIRNGLQRIVKTNQYSVQIYGTASTGKEALSMIQKFKPDIAIIDINMPEMDGLEVIRYATEEKIGTRFFILSGYDDFSYAQSAICYGVKYYFLKPLNIADFKKQFVKQCEEVCSARNVPSPLRSQVLPMVLESSREIYLNQLITGRTHPSNQEIEQFEELYFPLKNEKTCVVLFRFVNSQKNSPMNLEQVNQLFLKTCFSPLLFESWVFDEEQIVSIFNIAEDTDIAFRHGLRTCLDKIRQTLPCVVIAAIGSVVDNLSLCSSSFMKAQEVFTYRIYQPDADILDTHIISNKKPEFTKENIDIEPVVYSIVHARSSNIREFCNYFFKSLFFIQTPPPNFLFGMCMYLVMEVQKKLLLMHPDKKLQLDTKIMEISTLSSVEQLKQWLIATFINYSEVIKSATAKQNTILTKAHDYIISNLDKNIKAKDIASMVNVSESYFTTYFKENTGITFRDYILDARVEAAKKMLEKHSVSISDIAYKTGYQDYRSFSRAFKNKTGMSPSDYSGQFNR